MALPPRLVIVVGTYDGVIGGWERQTDGSLKLTLASAVHQGSLRSLVMAASNKESEAPGTLLSCGYDEMLRTHDWAKRLNSSGELRTPADFGTPICCSFAPPTTPPSTHCMIGFTGGKLCLYKKRDWSLQHVLAGHEGGVSSLGVHPTGKLALSGGQSDGKLKLWDLTKGRLAYATKAASPGGNSSLKSAFAPISSIVWTKDGSAYAWSYGNHITVRDVATGKDLLDIEVPSRVNQIALMVGEKGTFVAAACNDGSLPVLAVDDIDKNEDGVRRAIMAIEPVDKVVVGEERFKCIEVLDYDHGYYVVTATSAGVVSIMNLQGAVNMVLSDDEPNNENTEKDDSDDSSQESNSDRESDEEDLELAVDILDSVQLGTGARITCLAAWCSNIPIVTEEEKVEESSDEDDEEEAIKDEVKEDAKDSSRQKKPRKREVEEMDSSTVEKARALVQQAKKIEKKKKKRRKKK